MKRFILLLIPILLLASCAEKQQSPLAPAAPLLVIDALALPASGIIPFTAQLNALPNGGTPPYEIWWSHAIQEADSVGAQLLFTPEWQGDFTFVAHVRDAAGQLASDTVVVHADPAPTQFCWEDSVRLSVSSTVPYKETILENPQGLFYVLLRITYTCDPRTGFDVISGDGVHTVYQIIDPNPKRTGTETVDLFLPVQFPFAAKQRIAFTFQGGASGTYARLEKVTGCTQYPVPTAGVPFRVAQVVQQVEENKNL